MQVKNTFLHIFIFISNCTFGILQSFIGLFLFLFYINKKHYWYKGSIVTVAPKFPGGISLGIFIIVGSDISQEKASTSNLVNHELAHTRQSALLGIFYLFIIGIPSICWAGFIQTLVNKARAKKGLPALGYYAFYTERNAEWIKNKYLLKNEQANVCTVNNHMDF